MNKDDLFFISNNLSNLSGLPVRIYENNEKIFYYSTINFIKDPFDIIRPLTINLKEHITYFIDEYGFYYGIINFNKYQVIIGPTCEIEISEQSIKDLFFVLDIHPSEYEDFKVAIKSLITYPLMTILQMLCMVNFALTGEKETIANLTIHKNKQEVINNEIEEAKFNKDKSEYLKEVGPYNALDVENYIIDIVSRGDVAALEAYTKKIPAIRSGTVANDQLRQAKNIFIVSATLISRAAIRGGLDVTKSLRLSDIYIQKCESTKTIDEINELSYQMIIDYTKKVESIRFNEASSKLVMDVTRYIQNHISEAIKVEDIAKSVYLSRSRLSTLFKKETNINLHDYIYIIKLNEAKRLLRYTDSALSSIALYLSFSSQSHFSSFFKSKTGMTPNEYRQKHRRIN